MWFSKEILYTTMSSFNDRWKEAFDSNKDFGETLVDLLKALTVSAMIFSLQNYMLSLPTLKIIQDCLLNRKQRTKI